MANYLYGYRDSVNGYSDSNATSMRINFLQLPALVDVTVTVTSLGGTPTTYLITNAGTYNFSNSKGISVYIDPKYNDDYSAGVIEFQIYSYSNGSLLGGITPGASSVDVYDNPNFIYDVVGTNGNDYLIGDANANDMIGRDGNDILRGLGGADNLMGGNGYDTADYGGSNAAVSVSLVGSVSGGDAQGDTLASIEDIWGSAFSDTLTGDGSGNILFGDGGIDTLNGGGGNDFLEGGLDDDIVSGGDANDYILASHGADTINGGSGTDTLDVLYRYSTTAVTIDFRNLWSGGTGYINGSAVNSMESLAHMETSEYDDFMYIGNIATYYLVNDGAPNGVLLLGGDDQAAAGSLPSWINGGDGNDILVGDNGNDRLEGDDGNDRLLGFNGADILNGGDGNDSILVNSGSDIVNGGSGFDTLEINYFGNAFGVSINLSSMWTGGTGYIAGGTAIGIEGLETLYGSNYSDYIVTGNFSTHLIMSGDGVLLQGGDDSGVGGSLDDLFSGGAGDDEINGREGNDMLFGQADNDILNGDTGDDQIDGGDGIDLATYLNASSAVTLNLSITGSQATGSAGSDTLISIEGVIGSVYDDILTGNSGGNILSGAQGNDRMDGAAGVDTVDYSRTVLSGGVTVGLAIAIAQNTVNAGSDTLISIENAVGTYHADTLSGSNAQNNLSGGDGNDILSGGLGNDTLDGGEDIDTASYAGAASGVRVRLNVAGSQNTLAAGNDTLIGIENVTGTSFNDELTGNDDDNLLTGGNGGDLLIGGLGDDVLDGGVAVDTVSYAGNAVGVTVSLAMTSQQDTLGAGLDTLLAIENLTGSSFNDTLTGNSTLNVLLGGNGLDTIDGGGQNDTLDGGAHNDTLFGGAGEDILIGGTGNDTLDGGTQNDTASYAGATGAVTVSLALGGAQAVGGGLGSDTLISIERLIGSIFNDTLAGNSGINTITGGVGKDVMAGAGSNDRFVFLSTADSVAGANADGITDLSNGDIIDLSGIDANTGVDGDQGFALVGAITGAGQFTLIFDVLTNTTTLSAETTGDLVADMQILFTGDVTGMTGTWLL